MEAAERKAKTIERDKQRVFASRRRPGHARQPRQQQLTAAATSPTTVQR